jgi:hypothetical protein
MIFPDGDKQRKSIPIFTGCVLYFPNALAAVAEVSVAGNRQHNPGEPLHWARGKSMDHYNTALRHLIDHASGARFGADGKRHLAQAAWRVLAALQLDLEAEAYMNDAQPKDRVHALNCNCNADTDHAGACIGGKPIPGITEPALQGQCAQDTPIRPSGNGTLRPAWDHAPDCRGTHGYETSCTEANNHAAAGKLDTLRHERDARWEAQHALEDKLSASPDKWYIPKSIMEKQHGETDNREAQCATAVHIRGTGPVLPNTGQGPCEGSARPDRECTASSPTKDPGAGARDARRPDGG